MKILVIKAFLVSIITVLPLVGVTSGSRVGNMITYNVADTSLTISVKDIPSKPATDSVMLILSKLQNDVNKVNSKLDTGLQRQFNYIQSSNYLAIKFVEMKNEISNLNVKLKEKTVLPTQVIKDATQGNIQKDVFRMLVMIMFGIFFIVVVLLIIVIEYYKWRAKTKKLNLIK